MVSPGVLLGLESREAVHGGLVTQSDGAGLVTVDEGLRVENALGGVRRSPGPLELKHGRSGCCGCSH